MGRIWILLVQFGVKCPRARKTSLTFLAALTLRALGGRGTQICPHRLKIILDGPKPQVSVPHGPKRLSMEASKPSPAAYVDPT